MTAMTSNTNPLTPNGTKKGLPCHRFSDCRIAPILCIACVLCVYCLCIVCVLCVYYAHKFLTILTYPHTEQPLILLDFLELASVSSFLNRNIEPPKNLYFKGFFSLFVYCACIVQSAFSCPSCPPQSLKIFSTIKRSMYSGELPPAHISFLFHRKASAFINLSNCFSRNTGCLINTQYNLLSMF